MLCWFQCTTSHSSFGLKKKSPSFISTRFRFSAHLVINCHRLKLLPVCLSLNLLSDVVKINDGWKNKKSHKWGKTDAYNTVFLESLYWAILQKEKQLTKREIEKLMEEIFPIQKLTHSPTRPHLFYLLGVKIHIWP